MPLHHSALQDDYLPLLDELNRIVQQSGTPLEGNLFYYHHEPNLSRETIYEYFSGKRRNFASACRAGKKMLEIGLNGGHSALLALAQGVELHAVDICMHSYTEPVADFLKQTFKDRFHFYKGDSLEVLPRLHREQPDLRFDLIHIDGLHTLEHCRQDTLNALEMADKNAWIIIDDTDLPHIKAFYDELVEKKCIMPQTPNGWLNNRHHGIGKVI